MRVLPIIVLILLVAAASPSPSLADYVCGCGNDECDDVLPQDLPAVRFQIWLDGTQVVGTFDSDDSSGFVYVDPVVRQPMLDGRLTVRYMGEDRRADLGDGTSQELSVHFWHIGPSKAPAARADRRARPKHADGDANNIPVFEEGPVQSWNGQAESIIHFGTIAKGEGVSPCEWLVTRDIVWSSFVATESHSWGTIKARF